MSKFVIGRFCRFAVISQKCSGKRDERGNRLRFMSMSDFTIPNLPHSTPPTGRESIERDGHRYVREWPASKLEPTVPYIEKDGQRYLLDESDSITGSNPLRFIDLDPPVKSLGYKIADKHTLKCGQTISVPPLKMNQPLGKIMMFCNSDIGDVQYPIDWAVSMMTDGYDSPRLFILRL